MSFEEYLATLEEAAGSSPAGYTTRAAIIGFAIQVLRKEKGFSQMSLANVTGISQPTISRIELGEADVTASQIYSISLALDTTPSHLFELAETVGEAIQRHNVDVVTRLPKTSATGMQDVEVRSGEAGLVPLLSLVSPVGLAIASLAVSIIKSAAKK